MSEDVTILEKIAAEMMLEELESERLVVSLVPAWGWMGDDGGRLRIVESHNPWWYREFCYDYEANRSRPRRGRKPDTLIKRRCTLRALREIRGGGMPHAVRTASIALRTRLHRSPEGAASSM